MSLDWEELIPHLAHDVRALGRKCLTNAQLLERALDPEVVTAVAVHLGAIKESQQDLTRLLGRVVLLVETNSATDGGEMTQLRLALLGAKLDSRKALEEVGGELALSNVLPDCLVPHKTQMVLLELIDNSLRYRDAERPLRISIDVEQIEEVIRITVLDNGSGFNPLYAGKLFEPFQRLDGRRSGAGLGLAISKRIVEGAGGHIYWLASDPGATFVLELPVSQQVI